MTAVILQAEHRWECPNCAATHVSHEARPHTPFHHCRGLALMWVPYIPAGTRAKVSRVEREDYVGREEPHYDANGRPVMSVTVETATGVDAVAYVPPAIARRGEDF